MNSKYVIKEASEYLADSAGSVYICGEGGDFSGELFNRCLMPDTTIALPKMVINSIVDMRDGFPSQAFWSDYIVIRDPYRTDFQETQQVTYQIWDMLVNSKYSKEYYGLEKEYQLADDSGSIKIFKKIESLTPDIITHVSANIKEYYGNDSFTYEPDWFVALADFEHVHNVEYDIWNKSFNWTSDGQTSEILFNVNGEFNKLKFTLSCNQENDNFIVSIYGDGAIIHQNKMAGEVNNYDVDISEYDEIKIEVVKQNEKLTIWHLNDMILQ